MAQLSTSTPPSEDDIYLSEIISGAHGDKYQKDLALLIFERATRKGYDFRLGYEMMKADKFDDVAFFDKVSKKWTLIQTKHNDISKGKSSLMFDMLFPSDESTRDKGHFSLYKYFKSYVTVEANIKEQKSVIVFTNKSLVEFQDKSVEVVPRKVDEIFMLNQVKANNLEADNDKPRQVGFKVNEQWIQKLVDYANSDFIKLRDGIVRLFKEGILNPEVKNYKTPVTSILTKINSIVKFSETISPEAYEMIFSLDTLIDTKTAEVALTKCKDLFTGESRIKTWPLCTNTATADQFFQDLILFVGQPNDLSKIIDQDMRIWMRSWIRPQYYTRLEESQLEMVGNLHKFFNDKHSQNADVRSHREAQLAQQVENVLNKNKKQKKDNTSYKFFLQFKDGEKFLDDVRKKLEKQIYGLFNYNENHANEYYVSRQIEYIDNKLGNKRIRDDDFVNEIYGKFKEQPFLLLIAEPGMGKSTILEHIVMTAQRIGVDFVYLFYLGSFNQKLDNIAETASIEELLLILKPLLSDSSFGHLSKNMQCENKDVNFFIVFDAFDEVFPDNRKKVLKIFHRLMEKGNVKLLVSGRKNVQTVKNEFKVEAMNLVEFNEQDQINFLRKFWKVSEDDEVNFSKFLAQLFKGFHSKINSAIYEFTGLPLMLKMLAEVYGDEFEKYLVQNQNISEEIIPQKMFYVTTLYDQFVRKSFANKMVKKIGNSYNDNDTEYNSQIKNFILEHQLLAIKLLKLNIEDIVFNNKTNKEILDEFEKRLTDGTERSSLVEAFENNIKFVHLSYAEFLVAKFLFCNFLNYKTKIFAKKSSTKLMNQYPMIRKFFFLMIEKHQFAEYFKILERHYQENSDIALWACEVHGLETVKYLLCKIYDPTITNRLLHVAVTHNCLDICTYLFENHQVDVDWHIESKTALHIAAEQGHVDVVKLLIEKSADIEAKSKYDATPLHHAATRGRLKVVKMLIDNSADIETKLKLSKPLRFAAKYGKLEVVQLHIDKSADIEAKSKVFGTPLHRATSNGHLEVVQMLIDKSADIEAKSTFFGTPLHCAAIGGHLEVVKLLIDKSADIEAKTFFGKTPLHLAEELGHLEIVKMLNECIIALNIKAQLASAKLCDTYIGGCLN